MPEILVLGGGIAGISAVYHARLAGLDAEAFEARSRAGGTLDCFQVEGFTFDHAVHLSFSKDAYVRALFDRVPHHVYTPQPWCNESGRWLKHPVQSHLHDLPLGDRLSLLAGYFTRPGGAPTNYDDWLAMEYGHAFKDRFPGPYTEKYWTVPARELSTTWVGGRMRKGQTLELLRGALLSRAPNVYYAGEMRYPKQGGYRAFIEPLLEGLPVHCNKRATSIDLIAKRVEFADGAAQHYGHLVSTLPLPVFIGLIRDVPANIRDAAARLWATSVHLISVGLKRADAIPHLWSYLYDKDMLPARVYSPSLKAPSNAPTGCSSLQFEIYSSPAKPCPLPPDALREHCEALVPRLGFGSHDDVMFSHHTLLPHANVAFFNGMEGIRGGVREFLAGHGVQLAGRYGEWEYFWSDQSLLSGRRAAESLKRQRGGSPPDWLGQLATNSVVKTAT